MTLSISRTAMNENGPSDEAPIPFLNSQGRAWQAQPTASDAAIDKLRQAVPVPLPEEYFSLLRISNGGEGPIDLPPLYFQLYDAEYVGVLNRDSVQREAYPGFFVFGSDGGLESIAFDLREQTPWPIVMFDPVAGTESAEIIATNMADFIRAIGIDRRDFRSRISKND